MRLPGGGYRRDHLRALAQRVEVHAGEVRIIGSKSRLLQTLAANGSGTGVPTQGLNWRRACTRIRTVADLLPRERRACAAAVGTGRRNSLGFSLAYQRGVRIYRLV
jgi:hypothetical protein